LFPPSCSAQSKREGIELRNELRQFRGERDGHELLAPGCGFAFVYPPSFPYPTRDLAHVAIGGGEPNMLASNGEKNGIAHVLPECPSQRAKAWVAALASW